MLLLISRERCLSASDCASEPSRSCLLGFTRHAGDIQPRANLSYPTSPDICEYLAEKSRICDNRFEKLGVAPGPVQVTVAESTMNCAYGALFGTNAICPQLTTIEL